MKHARAICLIFCLLLILGTGTGHATSLWLHKQESTRDTPEFTKIWDYKPALVTTVYARDGQIIGHLYKEKRFLLQLDEMSPFLVKAFLAAEDSAFFEHEGVDLTAIFRALSKNLAAGGVVQGGSTITQQVVKRLLLTSEKSYARKIKEAILAYRLEHQMSKNQILTIYLNEIFLGAGAYGVEAAARNYFAKHANELTLAESAILAGLPKAPTKYNPYRFPKSAKMRQKYVLGRMLALNWITQNEYDTAMNQPLKYASMPDPSWTVGAYYMEEVRRWLLENLPRLKKFRTRKAGIKRSSKEILYEEGLHVYTALEMQHQTAARMALTDGLEASTKRRGWQGPVKHLIKGNYAQFINKQSDANLVLEEGSWVQALVKKVTKTQAFVQVGKRAGVISVKSMAWCRKPNPKRTPEASAKIKDARKVLKPGDVVWTSVLSPPETGVPLKLDLEQKPKVQGALVSIDPKTGDVLAMEGGYDFAKSQFNRATQAVRQPGSAFKPIVFSAALDDGYTVGTVINDQPFMKIDPVTMEVWQPKNYSGKYYGPTTLATALAKSRNLVTVRVADHIGIQKVIKRARELGITGELPPYLPISLGSVDVSPMNICQAYTAFARDGSYVRPRIVLSIQDNNGEEIYKAKEESIPAISPQNAFLMATMLKGVVQRGTSTKAKVLGRPVGGKTGTTNEEKDAWFIGFTPYLLTGVWVGFDKLTPMGRKETGSRAALPIWVKYRLSVEDQYPKQDFPVPPGIIFQESFRYNYDTGEEVSTGSLPYIEGTGPGYLDNDYNDPYYSPSTESSPLDINENRPYNDQRSTRRKRKAVPNSEDYILKQIY